MWQRKEIKPIKTFEGDAHPQSQRQFHWFERQEGLLTALFAGQEMMICLNDDDSTYQLTYLDMAHPVSFKDSQEAKDQAQIFAQSVLTHMMKINGIPFVDKDDPLYRYL